MTIKWLLQKLAWNLVVTIKWLLQKLAKTSMKPTCGDN